MRSFEELRKESVVADDTFADAMVCPGLIDHDRGGVFVADGGLGSIAPGKVANFTMLGDDPYTVDPGQLDQIPVLGTMYEGRWFPLSCT